MRVFLGLGANLAEPVHQLSCAIDILSCRSDMRLISVSPFYTSHPMGPQDQPDYVNAVVEIDTNLDPYALLALCQQIEQQQHRVKKTRWGARTLDIDILCMGALVINDDRLKIPHVGIAQRDFVLFPWRDIAPEFEIPHLGNVESLCDGVVSYHAVVLSGNGVGV